MDTEAGGRPRRGRRRSGRRRAGLERIPLPDLPRFPRQPAARGQFPPRSTRPESVEVTAAESDLLLGPLDPVTPEAGPAPASEPERTRTGEPGATILNEIVEQIEKDMEQELARRAPEDALPAYGWTAGCSIADDSDRR
jgi:hypothetical protein